MLSLTNSQTDRQTDNRLTDARTGWGNKMSPDSDRGWGGGGWGDTILYYTFFEIRKVLNAMYLYQSLRHLL